MRYLCLRNCYTIEDKYYQKNIVYDLPDEMFKAERNFQLVGIESPKPVEPMPVQLQEPTGDFEENPPLYVSDKPPKPKRQKRNKKGKVK